MRHSNGCLILVVSVVFGSWTAFAQSADLSANAACNFDSDRQISVDYQRFQHAQGKKALGSLVPFGKVWAPGGQPMTLFTNTPVSVGGKNLANGAYTMFVIPEEKWWTLIISKSTDTSGKYDESQDLARIRMEFGTLQNAEPSFSAYFAHVAADQCNLRLDLDQARAWVDFQRKLP
jgi:hypothetical protein